MKFLLSLLLLLSLTLSFSLSLSPKLFSTSLSKKFPHENIENLISNSSPPQDEYEWGELLDWCANHVSTMLFPSASSSSSSLSSPSPSTWSLLCDPVLTRYYHPLQQSKLSSITYPQSSLTHSSSSSSSLLPSEIHLQWNGEIDSMGVSFVTPNEYPDLTFTIQYEINNLVKGNYSLCSLSSSPQNVSFTSDSIVPCPNIGHLPYLCTQYHGTIFSLTPSTRYNYRVGNLKSDVWSPCYSFVTAPKQGLYRNDGKNTKDFHIIFYGDMGILPYGQQVTQWIIEKFHRDNQRGTPNTLNGGNSIDMILHCGDIAYAGVSNDKAGELEFLWDIYMQQISQMSTLIPYTVTVGNHESYYNYTAYQSRFRMPLFQQTSNFWYSMIYGPLYIISFSSEHDYSPNSPQWNYVIHQLTIAYSMKNQLGGIEFIILNCHRPLYSSDADEVNQHYPGSPLLKAFEENIIQYGVDLVLGGHMHVTERTYPVYNGTVDMSGSSQDGHVYTNSKYPVYITQGTAGIWIVPDKFVQPPPSWSAFRAIDYGFGELTFHSANSTTSSLKYQFFANGDEEPMDWVEIVHSY